jgi:hypothetical protein
MEMLSSDIDARPGRQPSHCHEAPHAPTPARIAVDPLGRTVTGS